MQTGAPRDGAAYTTGAGKYTQRRALELCQMNCTWIFDLSRGAAKPTGARHMFSATSARFVERRVLLVRHTHKNVFTIVQQRLEERSTLTTVFSIVQQRFVDRARRLAPVIRPLALVRGSLQLALETCTPRLVPVLNTPQAHPMSKLCRPVLKEGFVVHQHDEIRVLKQGCT